MKIKHKVQRKLDPTFQAELKLCSLCGPTPWWQRVVCVGSGDWPWRWLSGAHLPGRCICGVSGGVGVSASGPQRVALCWWAGCGWGLCVLWLWGWASCPPVSWRLHRRAPKPPGLRCFSQNPAFTLPVSELLLVLFFYLREADTDANTWRFIYKLELVSKYTQQSEAGTWRWVLA